MTYHSILAAAWCMLSLKTHNAPSTHPQVDTAARQAAARGMRLHDELRVLLVHGVLHLLGCVHA